MADEKPADLRPFEKVDGLGAADVEKRQWRQRLLSILKVVLWFVGGFGRVLKFIDTAIDWCDSLF